MDEGILYNQKGYITSHLLLDYWERIQVPYLYQVKLSQTRGIAINTMYKQYKQCFRGHFIVDVGEAFDTRALLLDHI